MDIKVMEAAAALGIMPRRTITRVKIFSSTWASTLSEIVNDWLEKQGPAFRLVDIKFAHAYENKGPLFSAMVIYTDLEPLEDDKEV